MNYLSVAGIFLLMSCGTGETATPDRETEETPSTGEQPPETNRTDWDDDTIFDTGIRETQEIPNDSGGVTRINL